MQKRHSMMLNNELSFDTSCITSAAMQNRNSLVRNSLVGMDIRAVEQRELFQVKALTDSEEWTDTLEYIQESYKYYPEGFLGAFKLPHRSLICICYAFPLSFNTAFLQYLLTKSGYRGLGIGSYLLNEMVNKLSHLNIAVNCVYENMHIYKRAGFEKCFNIFVYNKVPAANVELPEPTKSVFYIDSQEKKEKESCKILKKGDKGIKMVDIICYDGQMCEVPREKYVKSWLKNSEVLFCVAYSRFPKKNMLPVGYAAIRQVEKGHRVGPLYADSDEIAEDLLKTLLTMVSDDTMLQFYVPQQNRAAFAIIKRLLKVEPSEVFVRMYTKESIYVNFHKTYFMFNSDQVII